MEKPEYTRKQINDAGQVLVNPLSTMVEKEDALKVVDNWRAAHAYPMNTFAVNLRRKTADIEGAIVAQRLKRLDTICKKLIRFPDMKLYRMQDLGGCRVIVPTIEDVYKVKERLEKSRIRHEAKNPKNYILEPKVSTGYRGIHLIYKYKSDQNADYNGMLVEIQIRTKLQHLWATAVETVGVFTDNGLKFNQGSEQWLEFFKVISALFAKEEGTPVVDGVQDNILEIIGRIFELDKELGAFDKMSTIGFFAENIGHLQKNTGNGYYLLVLDLEEFKLSIQRFEGVEKGLEAATKAYNEIENTKGNKTIDAVLVGAQSYEALVDAYPNYFANITEFSDTVFKIIKKHLKVWERALEKFEEIKNLAESQNENNSFAINR